MELNQRNHKNVELVTRKRPKAEPRKPKKRSLESSCQINNGNEHPFSRLGFFLKPHCQSCDPNSISKIPALYKLMQTPFRMGEGFVLDDRNIKINLIGKIQPTQVKHEKIVFKK